MRGAEPGHGLGWQKDPDLKILPNFTLPLLPLTPALLKAEAAIPVEMISQSFATRCLRHFKEMK
jgi:hypothetical protein